MSDKLKISVDFYNDAEKALFQKYPNASEINKVIGEDIEISKDEFEGYMMFVDQMDRDGFRTYIELSQRVSKRIGDIDEFLSYDKDSIQAIMKSSEMFESGYTERIGVALGLCVINKLHGFTFADWKKIPKTSGRNAHPTFDFDLLPMASTGNKYIQVENKGSVVPDNSLSTTVSNHYSGDHGILKKKNYIRDEEKKKRIKLHKNLYYGTIGVLDSTNKAKLWLVDPPAFEMDMDPRKYKLLARLYYYLDEFKNIGVKDSIIIALNERIKLIANSNDYMGFNNKPISEKYVGYNYRLYMQNKVFSRVDTNEAFGRTYIVNYDGAKYCYLLALPKALMRIIVNQKFEDILNFKYNPDFINDNIQVRVQVSSEMESEFRSVENLNFVYNESSKLNEAVFYGKVSHTTDGRVFGLIGYETRETPNGGNNEIKTPVGVRGERRSLIDELNKQVQSQSGLAVKLPGVKRIEIPSIKPPKTNIKDIFNSRNKLKQKAKDKDSELFAETE